MKIFIVCNYLGGGGAERVAVSLATGLFKRGYEMYIVADLVTYRAYEVDKSIKLLNLYNPNKPKYVKVLQSIKNVRKYAKKYRPDLIITFLHFPSLASRFGVVGLGIPVIQTIHHALESDTYRIPPLVKFFDKHTSPLYAHTTLLTKPDVDFLGKRGKRISIMPNPLTFTPYEGELNKQKFIFSAGRLDDWHYKGWDILIKTIAELRSELKEKGWRVLLAGTGREESVAFLKNMCVDYQVDDLIEFLGFRKDILELFQKSSIFFLSSRTEGLPMVLIEAMSQGCACVATDFKGRTKEIVTNDKEGLLAQPEDYHTLAKHISLIINNPELRKDMQRQAIERSKFYLVDHVIDMWEDLISKVLNKNDNE